MEGPLKRICFEDPLLFTHALSQPTIIVILAPCLSLQNVSKIARVNRNLYAAFKSAYPPYAHATQHAGLYSSGSFPAALCSSGMKTCVALARDVLYDQYEHGGHEILRDACISVLCRQGRLDLLPELMGDYDFRISKRTKMLEFLRCIIQGTSPAVSIHETIAFAQRHYRGRSSLFMFDLDDEQSVFNIDNLESFISDVYQYRGFEWASYFVLYIANDNPWRRINLLGAILFKLIFVTHNESLALRYLELVNYIRDGDPRSLRNLLPPLNGGAVAKRLDEMINVSFT